MLRSRGCVPGQTQEAKLRRYDAGTLQTGADGKWNATEQMLQDNYWRVSGSAEFKGTEPGHLDKGSSIRGYDHGPFAEIAYLMGEAGFQDGWEVRECYLCTHAPVST